MARGAREIPIQEPITRIFATVERAGLGTLTISGPLALLAELTSSLRADQPLPEAGRSGHDPTPPSQDVPELADAGALT